MREGLECGIGIENFNDLKVGDRIESFRMEEVKRTLVPTAAAADRAARIGLGRSTSIALMIVAIQTWDLHLPGCHSLKEKRGVLKPLTGGLRRSFNVSVAETGHQDLWQRAEIACAVVGTRPAGRGGGAAGGRPGGRGDRRRCGSWIPATVFR